MGTNYSKLVSEIVKKYKKNKKKKTCEVRKPDKKAQDKAVETEPDTTELKRLLASIKAWRAVCKRINNIANLIGAELDEQGFPCSVSINPVFRPETHQTYSSHVKFLLSRMQLEELAHFYKGEKRTNKRKRSLCRDEICTMALSHADSILFEEQLADRTVLVTRRVAGVSKVFTFDFKELTDKKISDLLEKFINKTFRAV